MKLTRFISRILPFALFTVVLSCSEEAPQTRIEKNVSATEESAGEQLPDVDADRMLVVELEGMVCEMGCGGSIRKDFYGSEAVATVSFEFDEDKAVDVARVAYDRDLITADEIVGIINSTNDGQFKVVNTTSEALEGASYSDDSEDETEETVSKKQKVNIKATSTASISSGLFDLFSWL